MTCAAIACVTALVHGHMDTASAAATGHIRVPSPARTQALALGFEPVIADYYWIQALQIVGGRAITSREFQIIGELMDLVTTLDPWVDHPYRFAGLWLTHSADEVRHANALLEKGIAYHPRDWRNRFYLGYNLFFYLEDNARAADVLEAAVPLEGAPPYLGAFVTRLRASADSLDTAVLFLEQLIRQTADEQARAEYLKAFDETETERRARQLDRARVEFWKRHGRDIRSPAELWEGPQRVIGAMPPPHPRRRGFAWTLDAETGEIVSSFYRSRYRLHVHPDDEQERRVLRERASSPAQDGATPAEERG